MTDPRATPTPAGRRRFYLKQRIGQGAFGEVFLAEQDSGAGFRRPVAIKLLNPDVAGSREAARRMRDEARILGRLHHRNIVSVLDLVRVDERWAVIMDYVPGADLEQVLHALELTNGQFPPAAAFEVGAAVCRALHAAWHTDDSQGRQLQVVHRDIKPSNVRVTTDGEVKVLDFGVARVNLETREAATRAGGWIGTERYMAPERILMQGDSAAGDVYATGASIVELVLGRPLGKTPVYEEQHRAFVSEALAEVRAKLSGPPEVVDEAVARLERSLAGQPGDRPTAEELSKAFAALARRLEGESLAAFCLEFVPKVADVLGYTAVPVSGVLTENSEGSTGAPRGAVGAPSPMTIIPDGDNGGRTFDASMMSVEPLEARSTASTERTVVDAPPRSRVGWLPWVGLVALVGVTVAVLVAVAVLQGPDVVAPVPPAPVPVISAVAPEPPAPAPEPVVVVPVPAPVLLPEPASIARPTRPRPAPAPAPAPAPVEIAADAPRVSASLVTLANAAALEVTCGDKQSLGTASVRISDFPAGRCRVRASWLGNWLETDVRIEKPREVRCSVAGEVLTCT